MAPLVPDGVNEVVLVQLDGVVLLIDLDVDAAKFVSVSPANTELGVVERSELVEQLLIGG